MGQRLAGDAMSRMVRSARIDVLDDDVAIRSSLVLLMRANGWRVCSFASAGDWLDREGAAGDPDCLVLDLNLPDMDGAALLDHLVANDALLPVVVLTAYPDGPLAARARRAGATAILAKPAGVAGLAGEIRGILAAG